MAESNIDEATRLKLKSKLLEENVKLWQEPYTVPNKEEGQYPKAFLKRYSEELQFDEDVVVATLEVLRLHALARLASKRQTSDIVSLKIKLAGKIPSERTKEQRQFTVEVSLSSSVTDFKAQISEQCGIKSEYLKLIVSGKLLEDRHMLQDYYPFKPGATVMCICLSQSEVEARQDQARAERFARTRQGAELLAAKEDGGQDNAYYMQITNQKGRPVDLPKDQRRALVLAMTLHEKGRVLLKKKEYGEGLLLLLEADKEFNKCDSDIFTAVDNYAILCLDIVWCYLCLKNVNDLPDAEERLHACDMCFRKSYGPNLERLALVKGGTGSEKALFMRLHLLQGVLAYHQNKIEQANALFRRAEAEINTLRFGDEKMSELLNMGFTAREARLGLRMAEGNVQLAAEHIFTRREEKKEQRRTEKEEDRKKKIGSKLGVTLQGQPVNVDYYESLVKMGYNKGGSAEALRQTNNDINAAVQLLTDSPHFRTLPDPEAEQFQITDAMLSQVNALGFELDAARVALMHFKNLDLAVDGLLRTNGAALPEWFSSVDVHPSPALLDLQSPSPAPGSNNSNRANQEQPSTSRNAAAEENELINSVVEDLPQDDEEYLDLVLDEEAQLLQEYLTCLTSSQEH